MWSGNVTIEQYAQLPDLNDGTRDELIRGRVIRYPLAGSRHGVCCSAVARAIEDFNEANKIGVTTLRCGFIAGRHPDSVVAPDVLFWRNERRPSHDDSWPEVPPDFAIDVLDPGESEELIREKLSLYRDARVRLVWIVDPNEQHVVVHRADGFSRRINEGERLDGSDVLPGFMVQFGDLFS